MNAGYIFRPVRTSAAVVDIRLIHPGDQLVGDLLGRADDGGLTAAEHEPVD
jgi:hypothetical protein